MPEVSVIINCLNGEKYLPEALESLANQTHTDFEVIFWDNCSTDRSSAIAKTFGPRLIYHKSASTMPLGQARNRAIAASSAPYIAFLDCDDYWEREKLARQVALFNSNPALGLAATDTAVFNEKGVLYRLFERSRPGRGQVFEDLIVRQWVSMSSAMIRRSALEAIAERPQIWFDESLNVCEEADLFYRIAHEYELDYIPECLTRWRVHGANTTFGKFGQFAQETAAILRKHRRLYEDYEQQFPVAARALTERAAFQEAVSLWSAGSGKEARKRIRPHVWASRKYQAFWLLSMLPGGLFEILSRAYFALPGWLRK